MSGGDRMLDHGYGAVYAYYLEAFDFDASISLAEFGILKGTGLAIWCDLFPNASIIGLDIDLNHFSENEAILRQKGAFFHNRPELYEWDQLTDGAQDLKKILSGRVLDVVIDDGLHSREAIVNTFLATKPYLADHFVYFIEDYENLIEKYGSVFKGFDVHTYGLMSVILPAGIELERMR